MNNESRINRGLAVTRRVVAAGGAISPKNSLNGNFYYRTLYDITLR